MDNLITRIGKSIKKNLIGMSKMLPILIGIIMLINLFKNLIGYDFYTKFLTGNTLIDSFIVNGFGSIFAGNAILSYQIGNDMLLASVSLFLVLVFMLAWVTVGFIQLPAESILLGKKFAITRNIVAFFSNLVVALIVVLIMGVL